MAFSFSVQGGERPCLLQPLRYMSIISFDVYEYLFSTSNRQAQSSMASYYDILGVEPTATFAALKSAYRTKALACHPDRGGTHAAMVKVNEAWEVLSNAELRKQYDQLLKSGLNVDRQFDDARKRAEDYPRSWAKFDSWLNAIGRDFTDADYGSTEFMGMGVPTGGNSFSGWLFILGGGLLGLSLAGVLYMSLLPETTSGNLFPTSSPRPEHNPILARVLFVGLGAAGAWLGRLLHRGAGSIIGLWYSKITNGKRAGSARDTFPGSAADDEPPTKNSAEEARVLFSCPNCQQKLKLPSVDRVVHVTCPKCRHRFEKPISPSQSRNTSMQIPPSKNTIAKIFKSLLIAEIAIAAFILPISIIEASIIEQRGLIIETEDPNLFLSGISILLMIVMLAALITSWVGLFRFRRWARWLYLGTLLVANIVFIPFSCFDLSVHWGLSLSVSDISCYITGSILAIIFLSPLADQFQDPNTTIA